MGGIADYSGSLVLQRPIAEATWRPSSGSIAPSWKSSASAASRAPSLCETLAPGGAPVGYDEARRHVRRPPQYHWAAYIVGVVLVLARERGSAV